MDTDFKFMSCGIRSAARAFQHGVGGSATLEWDTESLAYECLSGQVHMRLKSMAYYSGIMAELLRTRYQVLAPRQAGRAYLGLHGHPVARTLTCLLP